MFNAHHSIRAALLAAILAAPAGSALAADKAPAPDSSITIPPILHPVPHDAYRAVARRIAPTDIIMKWMAPVPPALLKEYQVQKRMKVLELGVHKIKWVTVKTIKATQSRFIQAKLTSLDGIDKNPIVLRIQAVPVRVKMRIPASQPLFVAAFGQLPVEAVFPEPGN